MTSRSDSVTIRDVARQAGVSIATISRFINQSAPVSAEAASRIQQVLLDLNYQPHMAGRQLATRSTRTIGMVLHNMYTEFFAPLLSGISAVVNENQYNLLVTTYRSPGRKDSQLPIGAHNADGVLAFADCLSDEHLEQLRHDCVPLVLIHRTSPPGLGIPSVNVANRAVTRALIDHLIDVHHRRSIVFLRGPIEQEDTHSREQGYIDSLESHGIAIDEGLFADGKFYSAVAYQNIKQLISRGQHFDAIFAGNDDAAIGTLTALNEAGLRVPEDVAVVGFDDSRLSHFITPPLTTVHVPTEEVGRTAARLLFDLLQGVPVESVNFVPAGIVLRRSCGCVYDKAKVSFRP